MSQTEIHETVWEHIESLRVIIFKVLGVILVGCLISFCFYDTIFYFLERPLKEGSRSSLVHYELKNERIVNTSEAPQDYHASESIIVRKTSQGVIEKESGIFQIPPHGYLDIEKEVNSHKLVLFSPLEGLTLSIKTSFWAGFLITAPFWIGLIINFLLPGMQAYEKQLVVPFIALSFVFMGIGVGIAYTISLPFANEYLYAFNSGIGENLWSLSQYLSYTIALFLAHAIACEMCLVLLFIVHFEIVGAKTLESYRRQMIVTSFVLGALLTPPDVITQIILSTFLIGIYELAILYAKMRQKKGQPLPSLSSS